MDGTFRADRHVEPLKITGGEVVQPPKMHAAAAANWKQYIEPRLGLGVYEPAEAPLLALWCVVLARLMAVNDETPFGGLMEEETMYGVRYKKHPGVSMLKSLSEEFRSLSAQLGLDPISRMKLVEVSRRDDVDDVIDIPAAYQPAKGKRGGKKNS
jgi:P27 family predicted phage terminase small subunit